MRVADLIRWMESSLVVGSGEHAGENLTLLGWEKKFLRGVLAPGVQEGAVTVSRGNGKSSLLGALAAATLFGPDEFVIGGTEVVIFAASFTQAKVIFETVLEFVDGSFEDRSGFKVNDNEQTARIENKANGCRVRCMGSDSRRAHGIRRARLILGDEPSQWSPQVGERTYAALVTTIGKVPGCRLVLLGTRPDSETHFFAKALDGGADYSQVHAARPGDPPFRWSTIRRANPSVDHLPALAAAIRRDRDKARRDPAMFSAYAALRLNTGMSDTPQSHLLSAEEWTGIEGDAPRSGPCVWGVDLGGTRAQSAIASFWPESGRLEVVAAFPTHPDLHLRGTRDGVNTLYLDCQRRGELVVLGEHVVPVDQLLAEGLLRFGRPAAVAADRWRQGELIDGLTATKIRVPVDWRGQGYKDQGEDTRTFKVGCLDGKVTPVVSLLARSALAAARTVVDPAGNHKVVKVRQSARDDAAVAMVLAVSLGLRKPPPVPRRLRTALVG